MSRQFEVIGYQFRPFYGPDTVNHGWGEWENCDKYKYDEIQDYIISGYKYQARRIYARTEPNLLLDLAERAGFVIADDRIHFDEGTNVLASCPEAHKFAKLIVSECKQAIQADAQTINGEYSRAVCQAIESIEKRFDTEENL